MEMSSRPEQGRLTSMLTEYASGVMLLVPKRSKKLVLKTIIAASKRRIKWTMLFVFLNTFVSDKQELLRMSRKFVNALHREAAAVRLARRELASDAKEACSMCLSFKATDKCKSCERVATCCGCEGLCWECDKLVCMA